MGLFSKIKEGLKKTRDSVVGQIDSMLKSFTKIDDDLFEELEELLVMGDVGINTAQRICEELKARVKRDGVKDPNQIMGMLRNVVREMLEGDTSLHLATKPSIILVIGVNGVGKTTTIGKISARLTREGKKVVIAAADTFRAAAIDQLAVWADRSGADLVKQGEGSDPAAVVFDAISAAKSRNADVIICDTAGRLHNKKNLMDELSKIGRIIDRADQAGRHRPGRRGHRHQGGFECSGKVYRRRGADRRSSTLRPGGFRQRSVRAGASLKQETGEIILSGFTRRER